MRRSENTPESIRSILVCMNFSPASDGVLDHAIGWAAAFQAKLTVLHVDAFPGLSLLNAGFKRNLDETRNRLIEDIRARLAASGFSAYDLIQETGQPAKRILARLETGDYDLVILAKGHKNALERLLLGSTTRKVLDHCKTPLLVVDGSRPLL